MSPFTISFVDQNSKVLLETWGGSKGFDAKEALVAHMQERFEVQTIDIVEAKDDGDQLILLIRTDLWNKPREFALLSSGSLVW